MLALEVSVMGWEVCNEGESNERLKWKGYHESSNIGVVKE